MKITTSATAKRLLLFAALVFALPNMLRANQPPRTNIVLFLIDDLGWMDLGCQGSTFYQTPTIDRLAREGARFTDAYSACAVCSPTRAAILTAYSLDTGIDHSIRLLQRLPTWLGLVLLTAASSDVVRHLGFSGIGKVKVRT